MPNIQVIRPAMGYLLMNWLFRDAEYVPLTDYSLLLPGADGKRIIYSEDCAHALYPADISGAFHGHER